MTSESQISAIFARHFRLARINKNQLWLKHVHTRTHARTQRSLIAHITRTYLHIQSLPHQDIYFVFLYPTRAPLQATADTDSKSETKIMVQAGKNDWRNTIRKIPLKSVILPDLHSLTYSLTHPDWSSADYWPECEKAGVINHAQSLKKKLCHDPHLLPKHWYSIALRQTKKQGSTSCANNQKDHLYSFHPHTTHAYSWLHKAKCTGYINSLEHCFFIRLNK